MQVPSFLARRLREILENVVAGGGEDAKAAADILGALYRRKPAKALLGGTTIAQRREVKRERHREDTSQIRARCVARANGCCEACGNRFTAANPAEMDHWLGGSRRRSHQSYETCWMLCATCHRGRTNHRPSAVYWNEIREAFCRRFQYPFQPHIEHQPLRQEA